MKKAIIFIICIIATSLQSCMVSYQVFCTINNEEIIEVNSNGTYVYSLKLDIYDLISTMPSAKEEVEIFEAIKIDTTILFNKALSDTAVKLSPEEAQMFKDGSAQIKFDVSKKEIQVMIKLFCNNSEQLDFARKHIFNFATTNSEFAFSLLEPKTEIDDIVQQLQSKMGLITPGINFSLTNQNTQNLRDEMPGLNAFNPIGRAFLLTVTADSIKNSFEDSTTYEKVMSSDQWLQYLHNNKMFGETSFRTTIITPKQIKTYRGQLETFSADKKTITFKSTLADILKKPEVTGYFISFE